MLFTSCGSLRTNAPKTVESVDLEKYSGLWYEIASYPARFQKDCYCSTAEYTLSEDGKYVIVKNRCYKGSANGKEASVKGKAFVVKGSGNSKLKVQFFWPFKAPYWIIGLADDYSWALVSGPSRKYLWILSRTPDIDTATYNRIIEILKQKKFDTEKLQRRDQSCFK